MGALQCNTAYANANYKNLLYSWFCLAMCVL